MLPHGPLSHLLTAVSLPHVLCSEEKGSLQGTFEDGFMNVLAKVREAASQSMCQSVIVDQLVNQRSGRQSIQGGGLSQAA